MISTLAIRPENMLRALSPDMLATDLADYLVRRGVDFRSTHHISGACVALAEQRGVHMNELSVEDFRGIDARFGDDVLACFNIETSVEMRCAKGGTAKAQVLEQCQVLRGMLV